MPARAAGAVTFSLLRLQRLQLGFGDLRDGRPATVARERTLVRLVRQLGATAVPTCTRELAGNDDDRARWAYALLCAIADVEAQRDRVVSELRRLITAPIPDMAKLRALSLLSELGEPASADLTDPAAARARSLHDLASCLGTTAEIARAADLLIDQLASDELCEFIEDLASTEAARAAALAGEMLVRDDIDEKTRSRIRRLCSPAICQTGSLRTRIPRATTTRIGSHADGRRVVVAQARRSASRPPRWRVLCAVISGDDILVEGYYADELTHSDIRREVTSPLEQEGFALDHADPSTARDVLAQAARAARVLLPRVPRSYYVGRDMLGLTDEHLGPARSLRRGHDLAALLARATDLLAAGEPARARGVLERYITEVPDDPEGCAALGLCTLALGEADLARRYLERAAWLRPDDPHTLWNLAAAAHRSSQPGGCYLALSRYLDVDDPDDDGARREIARGFVQEYVRLTRLQHPDRDPDEVARRERPPARYRLTRLRPRRA